VSKLPAVLQKQVVRALYLRNRKYLQDMITIDRGRFAIFKVKDHYVPAEGLSWYLDFDECRAIVDRDLGWAYTPRPGDTVVDIGAGIGDAALVLSHLVGRAGRVICVEANPQAFRVLKQVVELNCLKNVELFNVAINTTNSVVEIEVGSSYLAGTIGGGHKRTATHAVKGMRLDDLLASADVQTIALLKSNIEGAERFVVETLGDYAAKVEHFAIACHDFRFHQEHNPFFETKDLVIEFLKSQSRTVLTQSSGLAWIDDWVYAA